MKKKEDFMERSEISSKTKKGVDNEFNKKKEKEYLENTCLNLRKILHILEL